MVKLAREVKLSYRVTLGGGDEKVFGTYLMSFAHTGSSEENRKYVRILNLVDSEYKSNGTTLVPRSWPEMLVLENEIFA